MIENKNNYLVKFYQPNKKKINKKLKREKGRSIFRYSEEWITWTKKISTKEYLKLTANKKNNFYKYLMDERSINKPIWFEIYKIANDGSIRNKPLHIYKDWMYIKFPNILKMYNIKRKLTRKLKNFITRKKTKKQKKCH